MPKDWRSYCQRSQRCLLLCSQTYLCICVCGTFNFSFDNSQDEDDPILFDYENDHPDTRFIYLICCESYLSGLSLKPVHACPKEIYVHVLRIMDHSFLCAYDYRRGSSSSIYCFASGSCCTNLLTIRNIFHIGKCNYKNKPRTLMTHFSHLCNNQRKQDLAQWFSFSRLALNGALSVAPSRERCAVLSSIAGR